jgi:NAD(P)-dependent dehydrogenase (short-subunit alcohol dehydrogenase family)
MARAHDPVAGRTALVTGAGNGIGRAIALMMAAHGARVILVGRDRGTLDSVAAEVAEIAQGGFSARGGARPGTAPGPAGAARPGCRAAACDTSDPGSVGQLAEALADEEVSILVNNAGIAGPVAELTQIEPREWDEVFAVNVRGVYLMCRAFLPAMARRGQGDVINLASVSGKRPLARRTPYAASKMAVIGLTATLAHEVGEYGVTVNSLSPGPVAGPRMSRVLALDAARRGVSAREAEQDFVARSAIKRMVTEAEVARAAIAMLGMPGLCGADIDLSGGMVAR